MLKDTVEQQFNIAIQNPDNIRDGVINWNFVEADIFLSIPDSVTQATEIGKLFDELANKVVDTVTA